MPWEEIARSQLATRRGRLGEWWVLVLTGDPHSGGSRSPPPSITLCPGSGVGVGPS